MIADPTSQTTDGDDAEKAAQFAAPFEGFISAPYRDASGVWTIGYGTTRIDGQPVGQDTPPITEAVGQQLMAADMQQAIDEVERDVKVSLTAGERLALDDFVYNLGSGAFRSSTLLRKLNDGDYVGAAAEIDKWDHAGGRVVAGLLRRRQAETAVFNT